MHPSRSSQVHVPSVSTGRIVSAERCSSQNRISLSTHWDAAAAGEPEKKRRFTLPSAYTILFVLIVLAAIATWIIPAGTYELTKDGEPKPGTYHEVESKPAKIVVDSLTAPINGLYGIEDAKGNINYYNSGTLFGAIDVALFIIVIGGFLGVTMKTGAIQAGIGRLVARLRGKERWMIPILMTVFAAVFPVIGATIAGTQGVDKYLVWSARNAGASERDMTKRSGWRSLRALTWP